MTLQGIECITISDSHYPHLLRQIPDPPTQLYVRGNKEMLNSPHLLAVVGSRKATLYGKEVIEHLLPSVVENNIVIVSGLAIGIDSLAHHISVNKKAPTIAVLGTGVDDKSIYPKNNLSLAHQIIEYGGVIVSEYAPGTSPQKHHFPARNRIVTGLCQATLIIQAGEKSGTLISARLATEYNREVIAVPGPINEELSLGTNRLIQEGAHVALEPQDILDLYDLQPLKSEQQITPGILQLEIPFHIPHVSETKFTKPSE